jgi:2-C-methyl-D-erythritol 2,4-cyclodiphosphate synthase
MSFRVGIGFDVHAFEEGRPLFLGGVQIPHTRGLAGHSDADALLHAISDAIFGALGQPDIGQHFPNTDPRWKDCPSRVFLAEAVRIAREAGYVVVNLDSTLLAEEPKMAPHIPAMRDLIAKELGIEPQQVGIKATTMEGLGFIGRREGIAAMAVVLLGEREAVISEP